MEDPNVKEEQVSIKQEEVSHTNSSAESQGEQVQANPSGIKE
jgi:hypothetical protein